MEHQGKTDKQVLDSERTAFWGVMFLFITIALLTITSETDLGPQQELKNAKLTIDSLNKRYDSLKWQFDSLSSEEANSSRMLTRYQVGFEIFLRRDPQGARIFGDIMSDETE